MIEWVMVRGYDEAHRRQDAPGSRNQAPSTPGDLSCPDVWTESRYQVFRRITDNSNAAMLNFHVSSTTIGFSSDCLYTRLFFHRFSLNSRQSKLKKFSKLKDFSPKIRIFLLNSREIPNFPHENERIFC